MNYVTFLIIELSGQISEQTRQEIYYTAIFRRVRATIVAVEKRYMGADKSLARPGRKEATATEDFDVHISCGNKMPTRRNR